MPDEKQFGQPLADGQIYLLLQLYFACDWPFRCWEEPPRTDLPPKVIKVLRNMRPKNQDDAAGKIGLLDQQSAMDYYGRRAGMSEADCLSSHGSL